MQLFRITTDNKITPGATGNRSGLVWMLSKIYKAFKGFLRGFSWLVAIYTAFVFRGLIWANRGLKRAYIKPLTIQDNRQPHHHPDTQNKGKIPILCDLYKNYALISFNHKIGCVCHFSILTILSFLDRGGFYI